MRLPLVGVRLPVLRCVDGRVRWLDSGDGAIFCRATLQCKDMCSLSSPWRISSPQAGQGTTIMAIFCWHCGRCMLSEFAKKARPHEGHGTEGGGIAARPRQLDRLEDLSPRGE